VLNAAQHRLVRNPNKTPTPRGGCAFGDISIKVDTSNIAQSAVPLLQ
jgi:hypothetical protein